MKKREKMRNPFKFQNGVNSNIDNVVGDWFIGTFAFYHSEKPKPKVFCKSGLGSFDPREHSWLPTLEDLFGMFDKRNLGETLYFLGDEVNDVNDLYEKTLDWVMLVNYNKSWNGKEWEEIK
jgi:hypothetical protein